MFSGLTSLTGGGGLSASSSAGSGDSATGDFNVGGMSFGASNKIDNNMLLIGVFAIAAVIYLKKG